MHRIYFDHNASSSVDNEVMDYVNNMQRVPYNASSVHSFGRDARSLLEVARGNVACAIKADLQNYNVIFTSSGTEANNMLVHGLNGQFICSDIEHISILSPAKQRNAQLVRVDGDGLVSAAHLEEVLQSNEGAKIVSIMLANNETGVIQNIQKLAEIAHRNGAIFHCDSVQAFGKIPVDLAEMDVDCVTIASHKVGGPLGAAALVMKRALNFLPLMFGGGQELGFRPSTENIYAISGFGYFAKNIEQSLVDFRKVKKLRDNLEAALLAEVPRLQIASIMAPRLPNTSMIMMDNTKSELQLIDFDLRSIAVSAGSACSSGKIVESHVLKAMGIDQENRGAVRVSLGKSNTQEEVDYFVKNWIEIYRKKL